MDLAVGRRVGFAVGVYRGDFVDEGVGPIVGLSVGSQMGMPVGIKLGDAVNRNVGKLVGLNVGGTVGVAEGALVGSLVGLRDGFLLGFFDGFGVVGECVGFVGQGRTHAVDVVSQTAAGLQQSEVLAHP